MTEILLVGPEPDKMPRLKLTYKCLKSLGHDVKVFAPFQRNGNTIMRYLANMVKLLFERSKEYHYFNIPDVIGLPLLFKRGRLVYDIRSPWKEVVKDTTGNKYLAKFAELIERLFCLKADVVVTANPLLGKRAKMYGAKEFVNVPNFLYEEMGTENWEVIRTMLQRNSEKEVALVLFFGKISKVEGSDILGDIIIKTLETIKTDFDLFDIHFMIVGDGPELQNLIDKIADEGIEMLGKVHFYGWLSHKLVGGFIKAADLCIMPRIEGGTMEWIHPDCVWKVNESLSIGTPVLATKYGGFNSENIFAPLFIAPNEDFPATIIVLTEIALRWGEESKLPIERDWKISREKLKEVYGSG